MAKDVSERADGDLLTQLRAEIALLRGQVAETQKATQETAAQKAEHARFLAWVALSAQEKTQLVADAKFAGAGGEPWEVSLHEQPTVRVPAHSEYEAIGRYNEVCGILGTQHKHAAVRLGAASGG